MSNVTGHNVIQEPTMRFVKSTRARVALIVGTFTVYALAYLPLRGQVGIAAGLLAIVPIGLAGWSLGIRGGLLAGLIVTPLHTILMNLASHPGWDVVLRETNGLGPLVNIIVGVASGYWSDLIQALQLQVARRKEAEEKLRQSEERIRSILDNMVEGCQIISHDWSYLYVNNAFAVQGGRKPEEWLGHTMLEMYPGIEATELFATLQRCMKDRTRHTMLNEFTFPAGSEDWFEFSIQPVPEGIFILSNDITERKHAEGLLRASEERYRDLVEVSPGAILVQIEERLAFVNPAAIKLLGAVHSGQLIGKSMWEIIHPDHHQIMRENIAKLTKGQHIPLKEVKFIRLDGSSVDVEVIPTQLVYQDQPAVQVIAQDITERKQAEDRRTILYETLNAVGAHLNTDAAARAAVEVIGRLGHWASAAISLANLDGQTWSTRAGAGWLVGQFGQSRSMYQGIIGRTYRTGQMQHVPDVSIDPDYFAGTGQPVLIRSQLAMPIKHDAQILGVLNLESETLNAFNPDDVSLAESLAGAMALAFGKARLYELAQQEIIERKQVEESLRAVHSQLQAQLVEIDELHVELREQAIRDPLTGLYNRRYLFEALALEVPRAIREGYPISIILLDIDLFKMINDTFGHDAGDKALQELAAQLRTSARVEDIVCRYGGDEHLIVMHNTTVDKAAERAEQIRIAIAGKHISHEDKSFKFTCSFGVAVFPIHAATIEGVISVADRALYQSKESGRNCVTLL